VAGNIRRRSFMGSEGFPVRPNYSPRHNVWMNSFPDRYGRIPRAAPPPRRCPPEHSPGIRAPWAASGRTCTKRGRRPGPWISMDPPALQFCPSVTIPSGHCFSGIPKNLLPCGTPAQGPTVSPEFHPPPVAPTSGQLRQGAAVGKGLRHMAR
jgi:hypothetical protein